MSKHASIVEAIKAAERCGDGHSNFWKNWMEDKASTIHYRNESFTGSLTDESFRMRMCEERRLINLTPEQRVWLDGIAFSDGDKDAP